MDQRVFRLWKNYRGLCLKVMAKKCLHALKILSLNCCCDLNLVAIYFAIKFFTNFQPHKLSILKKIFFFVQLLLSAIYGLFLSITGDAMFNCFGHNKVHSLYGI